MTKEMWVARDEDNELWLFAKKPKRKKGDILIQGYWCCSDLGVMRLDAHDPRFKDITWDNEPVKVELKLVK